MQRREFVTGMALGVAAGAVGGVAGRNVWARKYNSEPGEPSEPKREPIPEFARLSFSQQGEDIVIFHALRDTVKVEKPTYMDVGAAHPRRSNNTYLLYWTGRHGVLVEPNPMYADMLRRERPKDVVVQAGIGVTDDEAADYYEIKGNPLLNTFSPEQVKMLQQGKTESVVERVVKMPLLNINRVIDAQLHAAPDLLSTDVEGLDYAILKTLDLARFRPAVICAEGVEVQSSGKPSDITAYLTAQGYIPRGGSMVNSIFIDAKRIIG